MTTKCNCSWPEYLAFFLLWLMVLIINAMLPTLIEHNAHGFGPLISGAGSGIGTAGLFFLWDRLHRSKT